MSWNLFQTPWTGAVRKKSETVQCSSKN